MKLSGDNVKCLRNMGRNGLVVQARYQAEPKIQNVESDKEEQNYAGDSLNEIEPITRIRIGKVVWPCFNCYYQSVYSVVDQRYKDAANLNEKNVGNRLQILYRIVKVCGAGKSFGIGVKVFE